MANALESVLAALLGAGQGYLSFDQQRRERAMQDAARQRQQATDAQRDQAAQLDHLTKLATLRSQGVVPDSERQATTLAMPNPTMPGTVPLSIPEAGRYQSLGAGTGYSVDTLNTPDARARVAKETERRNLLQSYQQAGMSGPRAAAAVLNPSLADDFFKPAPAEKAEAPKTMETAGGIVQWDPQAKTWKPTGMQPYRAPERAGASDSRSIAQAMQFQSRFKQERSVQDAQEIGSQVQALEQLQAGRPLGSADLALLIGFNKVLDPATAVKEGEVALARSAQSVQARMNAWLANAREGTILPPELRQQLLDVTKQMAAVKLRNARRIRDDYRRLAQRNGWDPDLVTVGTQFLDEAPVSDASAPGAPAIAPGPVANPTAGTYSPNNPFAKRP